MLHALNVLVCILGVVSCLYGLCTTHIDNNNQPAFLAMSFMGLAWSGMMITAIAHDDNVSAWMLGIRILILLAVLASIYAMIKMNRLYRKHKEEDKT